MDREFCEAEFERFAEAMDLDLSAERMNAESKTDFDKLKSVFISEMQAGNLVVNGNGEPVYTCKAEPRQAITFHEPCGATYMASDSKKAGHDMAKTFASLAEMTRVDIKTYAKMPNRDLKVCTAIMRLFLG